MNVHVAPGKRDGGTAIAVPPPHAPGPAEARKRLSLQRLWFAAIESFSQRGYKGFAMTDEERLRLRRVFGVTNLST